MRVAVIGSWRKETTNYGWNLKNEEYFQQVCIKLGECLAKNKHQLVIARTKKDKVGNIADLFVFNGFKAIDKKGYEIYGNYEKSKVWAKAHIQCVQGADAVIVIGGADGTYIAGQTAIMLGKRLIPIPFFGGAAEELCGDYMYKVDKGWSAHEFSGDQSFNDDFLKSLMDQISVSLDDFPRVLIIHGRMKDRIELKRILNEDHLGIKFFSEPIVMKEHAMEAESISDLYEKLATDSDCAIALITPEDVGCEAVDKEGNHLKAVDAMKLSLRARQNIWIELGWFWGKLGRDRLMLLSRGEIEYPSDVSSFVRHDYKDSPIERINEIREFINKVKLNKINKNF